MQAKSEAGPNQFVTESDECMDGPNHLGQIIVIAIDMGQPGSFGAKFIALRKDAGEV